MANMGGWLAVLGGLIILISGLAYYASPAGYSVMPWYVAGTSGTALAVISGILALVGGWMLTKGKSSVGGALAVIFALVGFAAGGGWAIGSVLALIGGIWGFVKKP
ncbi:MAG: hypothetical protein HYW25_05320 [Candidatus Aenigmarchaeota archaeon]|nr:hypothetical protein [Candidatus Aenigmarchaeota archaeon]